MRKTVVEGKVTAITVTFEGIEISVAEYIFLNKKFRNNSLDYYIEGIVKRLRDREDPTFWMDSHETIQMWRKACSIQANMIESLNALSCKDEWK